MCHKTRPGNIYIHTRMSVTQHQTKPYSMNTYMHTSSSIHACVLHVEQIHGQRYIHNYIMITYIGVTLTSIPYLLLDILTLSSVSSVTVTPSPLQMEPPRNI